MNHSPKIAQADDFQDVPIDEIPRAFPDKKKPIIKNERIRSWFPTEKQPEEIPKPTVSLSDLAPIADEDILSNKDIVGLWHIDSDKLSSLIDSYNKYGYEKKNPDKDLFISETRPETGYKIPGRANFGRAALTGLEVIPETLENVTHGVIHDKGKGIYSDREGKSDPNLSQNLYEGDGGFGVWEGTREMAGKRGPSHLIASGFEFIGETASALDKIFWTAAEGASEGMHRAITKEMHDEVWTVFDTDVEKTIESIKKTANILWKYHAHYRPTQIKRYVLATGDVATINSILDNLSNVPGAPKFNKTENGYKESDVQKAIAFLGKDLEKSLTSEQAYTATQITKELVQDIETREAFLTWIENDPADLILEGLDVFLGTKGIISKLGKGSKITVDFVTTATPEIKKKIRSGKERGKAALDNINEILSSVADPQGLTPGGIQTQIPRVVDTDIENQMMRQGRPGQLEELSPEELADLENLDEAGTGLATDDALQGEIQPTPETMNALYDQYVNNERSLEDFSIQELHVIDQAAFGRRPAFTNTDPEQTAEIRRIRNEVRNEITRRDPDFFDRIDDQRMQQHRDRIDDPDFQRRRQQEFENLEPELEELISERVRLNSERIELERTGDNPERLQQITSRLNEISERHREIAQNRYRNVRGASEVTQSNPSEQANRYETLTYAELQARAGVPAIDNLIESRQNDASELTRINREFGEAIDRRSQLDPDSDEIMDIENTIDESPTNYAFAMQEIVADRLGIATDDHAASSFFDDVFNESSVSIREHGLSDADVMADIDEWVRIGREQGLDQSGTTAAPWDNVSGQTEGVRDQTIETASERVSADRTELNQLRDARDSGDTVTRREQNLAYDLAVHYAIHFNPELPQELRSAERFDAINEVIQSKYAETGDINQAARAVVDYFEEGGTLDSATPEAAAIVDEKIDTSKMEGTGKKVSIEELEAELDELFADADIDSESGNSIIDMLTDEDGFINFHAGISLDDIAKAAKISVDKAEKIINDLKNKFDKSNIPLEEQARSGKTIKRKGRKTAAGASFARMPADFVEAQYFPILETLYKSVKNWWGFTRQRQKLRKDVQPRGTPFMSRNKLRDIDAAMAEETRSMLQNVYEQAGLTPKEGQVREQIDAIRSLSEGKIPLKSTLLIDEIKQARHQVVTHIELDNFRKAILSKNEKMRNMEIDANNAIGAARDLKTRIEDQIGKMSRNTFESDNSLTKMKKMLDDFLAQHSRFDEIRLKKMTEALVKDPNIRNHPAFKAYLHHYEFMDDQGRIIPEITVANQVAFRNVLREALGGKKRTQQIEGVEESQLDDLYDKLKTDPKFEKYRNAFAVDFQTMTAEEMIDLWYNLHDRFMHPSSFSAGLTHDDFKQITEAIKQDLHTWTHQKNKNGNLHRDREQLRKLSVGLDNITTELDKSFSDAALDTLFKYKDDDEGYNKIYRFFTADMSAPTIRNVMDFLFYEPPKKGTAQLTGSGGFTKKSTKQLTKSELKTAIGNFSATDPKYWTHEQRLAVFRGAMIHQIFDKAIDTSRISKKTDALDGASMREGQRKVNINALKDTLDNIGDEKGVAIFGEEIWTNLRSMKLSSALSQFLSQKKGAAAGGVAAGALASKMGADTIETLFAAFGGGAIAKVLGLAEKLRYNAKWQRKIQFDPAPKVDLWKLTKALYLWSPATKFGARRLQDLDKADDTMKIRGAAAGVTNQARKALEPLVPDFVENQVKQLMNFK